MLAPGRAATPVGPSGIFLTGEFFVGTIPVCGQIEERIGSLMERGLPILLVEDNQDDVFMFQRAFQKLDLGSVVRVVSSGEESVNYLRGVNQFEDRKQYPFPSVIFMALSSPEKGGFEVLEWLRRHPECNVIPVIIFSGMQRDEVVKKAFALGVHGFFEKPFDLEDLVKRLKQIYDYWSTSNKPKMPPGC